MQKQYIIASDVTDGSQRGEMPPPGNLNVKTGPAATLSDISVLVLVWVSVGCCFFAFFGLFSGDLGFSIVIHIQIHHHFSSFFRVLASGPCTVAGGPLLAKFLHTDSKL